MGSFVACGGYICFTQKDVKILPKEHRSVMIKIFLYSIEFLKFRVNTLPPLRNF